jgi:glycosyltransferase involved in cell wall biosynthesis
MMAQPAPEIDVSVVVPTYNRRNAVARTITSLLQQRADTVRYEVIVVDNNSTDDTRTVVEAFMPGAPHLRYLLESRRGVSNARNSGATFARAPIVAFIDDDVEADPDWLVTIVRTLHAHPDVDCLGGEIVPRWSAPPPSWLTPRFWGAVALQSAARATPYVDATRASACMMTANFACRRDALMEVGGFSPLFLRDEDRELQLRMWDAGKRGMFVPEMRVTAEVPPERLTRGYHRQFYRQAGSSHARMRYLDRIDAEGRLVPALPGKTELFGVPAFIYRRLANHLVAWVRSTLRGDWDEAFFHDSRALYHASYIWRRAAEWGRPWWMIPLEVVRFVHSLRVPRVIRSAAVPR